jgi:hypothetical protein
MFARLLARPSPFNNLNGRNHNFNDYRNRNRNDRNLNDIMARCTPG